MAKEPRVSIYVQMGIKNRPKDWKGLYSEGFTLNSEYLSLDQVCLGFISKARSYFLAVTDRETVDEAIDVLTNTLKQAQENR